MLTYENSGFSLEAKVRIEAWDREGLERLIRYCSRPCFASENLRWNGPWLIYRLPKPTHTGQTFVQLEPIDFLDRIAAFIPPPRRHRHHYHGVFAPNAPQRRLIAASASQTPKSRKIPAVLLPPFEYAYCLSVHKSQGSEFDHVLLLMPEGAEVFGREVLYTAVTRAKKKLEVWSTETVLQNALKRPSQRLSGISSRLQTCADRLHRRQDEEKPDQNAGRRSGDRRSFAL